MLVHLRPAIVLALLFTALTGLAYPLLMTGLAQALLPTAANGSLVTREGGVVGSALVGQSFAEARYFHGRPSAAGASGYDAAASSGSNLGPLSKKLHERVGASIAELRAEGAQSVPADAVTASGSGLDPHISPEFAALQAQRVADARGVPLERVLAIVGRETERPLLGFLGEARINVLNLNLALDAELKPGAG
jgi:potassium-transporting ATPase KdpC subunit